MIASLTAKLVAAGLLLAALVGLYGLGHHRGAASVQAQWDKQARAEAMAAQIQVDKSELVSQMVVDHYIDRVQIVLAQGAVITKEVPVYVTPTADARCTVPVGFVRLHDAAAQGQSLPAAPVAAVDAPSGLALSAVASTVAGNYGICRATAERLSALQDWVKRQHEVTGP